MCMTCDPTNVQIVKDVIAGLVEGNEMFTAWDVTTASKKAGATQFHSDMKNVVHDAYIDGEMSGYSRTLIPTPTGDAWLYHSGGADLQSFIAHINGKPAPIAYPAMPAADPIVGSMTALPSVIKKQAIDADGRLPIYEDMLEGINARTGETVFVNIHPDRIVVCNPSWSAGPDHMYSVNSDGRVRISPSILENIKSAQGVYSIEHDTTNQILVIKPL